MTFFELGNEKLVFFNSKSVFQGYFQYFNVSLPLQLMNWNMEDKERIVFLDWLRVIACIMVMLIHSTEPFYLGNDGTLITCEANAFWSTIIDSALRAAVPLYVMTSSYLLFPLKTDTRSFFKRRFTRVGFPLLFWLLAYSFLPMVGNGFDSVDFAANAKHLLLNFPFTAGHLWFLYMILGIYLAMPIFSPWVSKLSKRGEKYFLVLWLFTTLVPFFRKLADVVFDLPEVFGEASWNEFSTLYYISGFMGYVILAHYMKTHLPKFTWHKTLFTAIPLWIVGFTIVASWFWYAIPKSFPVDTDINLAIHLETSWTYCSIGVALTTIAYFLIARHFTASGSFYHRWIIPLSRLSFGIYLIHIFFLGIVFQGVTLLLSSWDTWIATPITIFLTGIITFVIAAIVTKLISYLPFSKYIIG